MVAERDDLVMMQHPEQWPRWPKLPVVRRSEFKKNTGVLLELGFHDDVKPTVYLINLFDPILKLSDIEQIKYESFDALIADGWHVD
jgi:hypothetical protein